MKTRLFIGSVCALMSLGFSSGVAHATPDDRLIAFDVFVDPNTPANGLRYQIQLDVSYADTNGNLVGWQVNEIVFRKFDSSGHEVTVWSEILPDVMTGDGLWWIDHKDPDSPELAEFVVPPAIVGVASAQSGTTHELDYAFEGEIYQAPPGGSHFPLSASISVYAQEEEIPEPDLDDVEEPVQPGDLL